MKRIITGAIPSYGDGGEQQDGDYPVFIESPETLARAFVNGWVVDGRDGGLVVGRRHSEGHIAMLQPTDKLGAYAFVGFMEGGEYLMSTDATAAHFERLKEINADRGPEETVEPPRHANNIIDTRAEPHDKLLVICKQFIINRNSTLRHFEELERMNNAYRYHRGQFFPDEYIVEMMEADVDYGPQYRK